MIRTTKALALALIVLTFLGTSGAWHVPANDPDAPLLVAHDHTAHREQLRKPAAHEAPTHCAICHWLQGFRSESVRAGRFEAARRPCGSVQAAAIEPIRPADLFAVPPRAPPA